MFTLDTKKIRNVTAIALGLFATFALVASFVGPLVSVANATTDDITTTANEYQTPVLGSITVCKIAVNEEGNLISGKEGESFSISITSEDYSIGVIAEPSFDAPLIYNTKILSGVEEMDAVCVSYNDLIIGEYYYGEETIVGDNWLTPLYNDQFEFDSKVTTISDFYTYSEELFTSDTSDDDERNKNSDGHIILKENRPDRTLVVLNQFDTPTPPKPITLSATKIICENEEDLPNWGAGGTDITATTAIDFVVANESCEIAPDWYFQWAPQGTLNPGDNTGEAVGDWTTFSGTTEIDATSNEGDNFVWVREVWNDEYIPFTGVNTTENVSAEVYGNTDVLNYDNYDRIDNIEEGGIYYVVAFNAPAEEEPNPDLSICPFSVQDGRTIVDFGEGLWNTSNKLGPYVATLSTGTYDVSLATYDNHSDKPSQNQTNEQWYVGLENELGDTIVYSNMIDDLPENLDQFSQMVNDNLFVGSDISHMSVYHVDYPDNATSSLVPICAAFDLQDDPIVLPQCSDGIDNDGDSLIDADDPACFVDDVYDPELDDESNDPVVLTQCSDNVDNDGDGLIDYPADPGCESLDDDNEIDGPLPYAPYCGDGEVNQEWEVCDGGDQCSEQCLPVDDNQCRDLALARVNVTEFNNYSNGDVTSDIFLGSSGNKIPGSTWFPIWENGIYINDADIVSHEDAPGYEDVPGLAVQRQEGSVRTVLFGSHSADGSKEHIQGNIEFSKVTPVSQTSDDSGNNKLENGFDLVKDNVPGQDEVWLDNAISYFWLTVTVADDGFYTNYDEPNLCPIIENEKPVITVAPSSITILVGDTFDPLSGFATATDTEDGDITASITASSSVATSTPGTYQVDYDVEDSEGLTADTQTLTVVVTEGEVVSPQCSDGIDNDGDELIDEEDPTCSRDGTYDPNIDNEENQKPVISITGGSVEIFVGGSYTEEGATADDTEDGNGLEVTDISGSIDVNTVGSYTVLYNFVDSEGLSADEVERTVTVKSQGGGGGGGIVLSSGGGGGGGPIQPSLRITNEAVTSSIPGLAVVTWNTNLPATSKVLYGTESNLVVGPSPLYGYPNSSLQITTFSKEHSVIIAGLDPDEQYYFRPFSDSAALKAIGIELTLANIVQPVASAPAQCDYLKDFLRLGDNNDPVEVEKLQSFLRDLEGFSDLEVTGIFDQATFDAVSEFQSRYRDEVLTPWGLPDTTGYVYLTTQKKVNEIYCQSEFPLTDAEQDEVDSFRSFVDVLREEGASDEDLETILQNIGSTGGATGEALAVVGTETTGAVESGENVGENVAAVALVDRFPQVNSLVAGVFTIPDDISGLYDCLIDLLLILFIIAILWLIVKETLLYRKSEPTKEHLERDRTLFFGGSMLVAIATASLLGIYCVILPLAVIFIVLVGYYSFFTRKKTNK